MKIVAISVLSGFVLFVMSAFSGVFSAGAQDVPPLPPESSPFLTACNTAYLLAVQSNVTLEYCRRASEVKEGNLALVTVKVKIADRGLYFVSVGLQRTEWVQQTLAINPVP